MTSIRRDRRSGLGPRRHRSGSTEHDPLDLIAADYADQLARDAVNKDQHEEPELDGPEMGPYDLAPQTLGRGREVFHADTQRQKMLEVVQDHGGDDVDPRLPQHVVDQRLLWKPIDDRQHVGHQHYLGNDERSDRGAGHRGETQAVLLEHQRSVQQHDVKSDPEKDGWWKRFTELVLDLRPDITHVALLSASRARSAQKPGFPAGIRRIGA